ncbi:MAG: rhamnulokinase [Ruminococcaceae bacterium]|nr:rhamnulokinase [Oscillospiraceae bacterium]
MRSYSLAIDIGASSGRHILGWLENGILKTEEIYRFPNNPTTVTKDGARCLKWDIDRLFKEILTGLAKAAELGKIPETVGIDTWGVDYVLLDKNDEAIEGAYCYRDSRTDLSIPKVHEKIPFEKLYEKTGIQFASFNTVYQLYHDRMTGRLDKAAAFLMLPDYFHFRLTGKKVQDYTNATTTGMVNAKTGTWDDEILDLLGCDKSIFRTPSKPSTTVGTFSPEVAARVGYEARIVLPATHDTASAIVAAPLKGEAPYISSGTWSLLGVEQPFAHTDAAACKADYSNEGAPEGKFRLQKNIMGLWLLQQVRHEADDKYSFAELTDMARENPIDATFDVNEKKFMAPVSMTETIKETVGRDLSIGEIAYTILNNLARSYAASLEALEGVTGNRYATLNIIGGGSKNELLNELTIRHTGKKLITGPTEGTAIGNLLMQFIGRGEIRDVAEGREIVEKSFDIQIH